MKACGMEDLNQLGQAYYSNRKAQDRNVWKAPIEALLLEHLIPRVGKACHDMKRGFCGTSTSQ